MKKLVKKRQYSYISSLFSNQKIKKIVTVSCIVILLSIVIGAFSGRPSPSSPKLDIGTNTNTNIDTEVDPDYQPPYPEPTTPPTPPSEPLYNVVSVVDGDTIKIDYNGATESVRLIGVNTPETVDPRKTVECFGAEASNYLKNLLTGKRVSLEADSTQSDRDKYNRLLRYVYLDGKDVGYNIIASGYGHEYTYYIPYAKQNEYKTAEKNAESQGLGLWSPSACPANSSSSANSPSTVPTRDTATNQATQECKIKGNINNKGEKIYHIPGQKYYDATVITPSKGERYFCTEDEAINAGWRRSKV